MNIKFLLTEGKGMQMTTKKLVGPVYPGLAIPGKKIYFEMVQMEMINFSES